MTAPPGSPPLALRHGPVEVLLGFARCVRAAGVAVTPDRERTFLDAAAALSLADGYAVWAAGRATLCATPQDLQRYDRAFMSWFSQPWPSLGGIRPPEANTISPTPVQERPGQGSGEHQDEGLRVSASATEVLRHKDVSDLSPREKAYLARMFALVAPRPPQRRALRGMPARRGRVDARVMLRDQVRRMGEPGRVAYRRRGRRARHVVLLLDVSGSMSGYAEALLRLAHRFVTSVPKTEVFTVGTRLTHLTRALAAPDVERALIEAGRVVPDWSGGTRLGEGLEAFLDRWGRRGMARGCVVVIFSDGWERNDPQALGEQMRRLSRLAHKVVWVNPHRGKHGYQPVQAGIVAVRPFVDELVAGHSLATFQELTEVIAGA
ncbi:MAG: vWA domain-containing protein [Nostocoides sp.]